MKKIFVVLFFCSLGYGQDFNRFIPKNFVVKKAPRHASIAPTTVLHGSLQQKKIALTFDACATAYKSKFDKKIEEILIQEKIPATIFIGGKWALEHQAELLRISKIPYVEIGNHSFLHPHCTEIPLKKFEQEVELTQNIIFTITGKTPNLFRPPYGEFNDTLVTLLAKWGMKLVEYNLPSGDPDTNATKQKLVDYVSVKAKNGSIIVMHINGRGWHTAEALPEIILRLRKKNFEFVTVSELFEEKKK